MNLKKLIIILFSLFFSFTLQAEDLKMKNKNTEFNVYTGMFDFSDDEKIYTNWFSTSK